MDVGVVVVVVDYCPLPMHYYYLLFDVAENCYCHCIRSGVVQHLNLLLSMKNCSAVVIIRQNLCALVGQIEFDWTWKWMMMCTCNHWPNQCSVMVIFVTFDRLVDSVDLNLTDDDRFVMCPAKVCFGQVKPTGIQLVVHVLMYVTLCDMETGKSKQKKKMLIVLRPQYPLYLNVSTFLYSNLHEIFYPNGHHSISFIC